MFFYVVFWLNNISLLKSWMERLLMSSTACAISTTRTLLTFLFLYIVCICCFEMSTLSKKRFCGLNGISIRGKHSVCASAYEIHFHLTARNLRASSTNSSVHLLIDLLTSHDFPARPPPAWRWYWDHANNIELIITGSRVPASCITSIQDRREQPLIHND